jgi:hypothetical protein
MTPASKWITIYFVILLLFLAVVIIIAEPTQAALVNGTEYYNNITPHNDPMELKVHPGDTIYLGRSYDLTDVLGWNYSFSNWKDWKIEGSDCNPDVTVDVDYIRTNTGTDPKLVYLDPSIWKTGDWFQYEGCYAVMQRNSDGTISEVMTPYMRDNNRMFTIIYPPVKLLPSSPLAGQIVPVQGYQSPFVNVTLAATTTSQQEIPMQDSGWPWWYYLAGIIVVLIVLKYTW